jgi:HPt (histidine-containing phosphotransfer) domain-containing protein
MLASNFASAAGDSALDAQALAGLRALDPSGENRLIERVVRAFESSSDKLLPQLRDALGSSDGETIRHVAHTLKSSSASVGALKLSRLCAEIEAMMREGLKDGIDTRVALVHAEVEGTRRALRRLLEGQA